jgi:hypothetical protein
MLEANPRLSPTEVKRLLLETARPVAGLPAIRQGCGVLDARAAIDAARREAHAGGAEAFAGPRIDGGRLRLSYHDDSVSSVSVAGDFNGWMPEPLEPAGEGTWRLSRPAPPPGRHLYKLVVDGHRWIPDPSNAVREPDPYGGFNSVLVVKPDLRAGIG